VSTSSGPGQDDVTTGGQDSGEAGPDAVPQQSESESSESEKSQECQSKSRHRKGAPTPKQPLCACCHNFTYVFFALATVLIDPFNWTETTSKLSQDIVQRLLIGPTYSTEHQDRTTVVLFRERTLIELRKNQNDKDIHWPVSLKWHAKVLENILAFGPDAVMVDFIFPDRRPDDQGVEAILKVNESYHDEGIPLIFARAQGPDVPWIRSDLIEHLTFTSILRPDEPGIAHGMSRRYEPCSKVTVFDEADTNSGRGVCACATEDHQIKACSSSLDGSSTRSEIAYTAAFQLFNAVEGHPPKAFDPDRPLDLQVEWSNQLNELNDWWMKKVVNGTRTNLCKDVSTEKWNWLRAIFEIDRFKQACPYTYSLPADLILLHPNDPMNGRYLRDVVVLYGGDLAGLADTVVPPTHVKLPGVFLHAMAFDNLLTSKGEYRRSLGDVVGGTWATAINLIFAAVSAIAVVSFARSRFAYSLAFRCRDKNGTGQCTEVLVPRPVCWMCFIWLITGAIWAICFVVYWKGQLAPLDWLGATIFFGSLGLIVQGRFFERFFAFCKKSAQRFHACFKSYVNVIFKRQNLEEERR
jgi:hypothetical protein